MINRRNSVMRYAVMKRASAVFIGALICSGCMTFVTSEKGSDTKRGQVYYLPMPVIAVTPKADGTAEVKVEYLPDPSKSYVLRATSFLSSYTLDVQTENGGLLKTVSLDADSTQVASAAQDAAISYADKVFTATKEAAESKANEAKTRREKERELREAVAVAKRKLKKLEELQKDPDNGITNSAIAQAKLTLDEAETKLSLFLAESSEDIDRVGDDGAFDGSEVVRQEAPGPVLFQVIMERDSNGQPTVKLRAMKNQENFDTATISDPAEMEAPRLLVGGSRYVTRAANSGADFVIKFDDKVRMDTASIEGGRIFGPFEEVQAPPNLVARSFQEAGIGLSQDPDKSKHITITFPRSDTLPDGRYFVSFPAFYGEGDESFSVEIDFVLLFREQSE